jgi:molybdopterin-guanine dinucleotide biosynthesis protein A
MIEAAGIILAGGKSSRFEGNKALAEIASQRLIDRISRELGKVFPRLLLVTNTPEEYRDLGIEMKPDLIPGKGPLSGIHAGLVASPCELNFITACDMPFINADLAAYMVQAATSADDVVVPLIGGFPEPLMAVYRRSCRTFIERSLLVGCYKVTGFYPEVAVRFLPEQELAGLGVTKRDFFNINTREDLKKAAQMLINK